MSCEIFDKSSVAFLIRLSILSGVKLYGSTVALIPAHVQQCSRMGPVLYEKKKHIFLPYKEIA